MHYSRINNFDVLNGEGFRVTLFVSGCNKKPKCRNCQNPQAWCFKHGFEFTNKTKETILKALDNKAINGLSLSGGEITDNLEDGTIFNLLDEVKILYPNKTIWAWSGYTYEEIIKDPLKAKLMRYINVLIDGEFIPELKDLNRPWGNSSNQRVIDVNKSLETGEVVLYL